jgi:hypothetical protein
MYQISPNLIIIIIILLDPLGNWVIALANIGIGEPNATDINTVVIQTQTTVFKASSNAASENCPKSRLVSLLSYP